MSFKKTKQGYDKLKKSGLENIPEAHKFIDKGDKKGLINFANGLDDKMLKDDCLRVAKYL